MACHGSAAIVFYGSVAIVFSVFKSLGVSHVHAHSGFSRMVGSSLYSVGRKAQPPEESPTITTVAVSGPAGDLNHRTYWLQPGDKTTRPLQSVMIVATASRQGKPHPLSVSNGHVVSSQTHHMPSF